MSRSSFEKINFSIRPAKSVERKMISFALRKLAVYANLSSYRYIGFGSTYFTDFSLFHLDLGVNDLISIEIEEEKEDRFRFNLPFDCIKLKMGSSNSILPSLDWDKKTILWLDYDSVINNDHFADISTFCTSATSASVVLITVNCHANNFGKTNSERLVRLGDEIGDEHLPSDVKISDYSHEEFPIVLKKIYENEINSKLREANGLKDQDEKLKYFPLFNFTYKDGVKMLTIGGIVLNTNDEIKLKDANFKELEFYRRDDDIFKIKIPSITPKEIRFLNSQLPNGINRNGKLRKTKIANNLKPDIPQIDMKEYSKIYKYFPLFSETKFS